MLRLLLLYTFTAIGISLFAQNLEGSWEGKMKTPQDKSNYALHLKRLTGGLYFGVSEPGNRKGQRRLVLAQFHDTLWVTKKQFTLNNLWVAEIAYFSGTTTNFLKRSFQLTTALDGAVKTISPRNEKNPTQLSLTKTGDQFPSEFQSLVPTGELLKITKIEYENREHNGRISPMDIGKLRIFFKHGLPTEQALSYKADLHFNNPYIHSEYDGEQRNMNASETSILFRNIEPEYGLVSDSVTGRLQIFLNNELPITANFTLQALPFVRAEQVHLPANHALHMRAMSGYYGLNGSRWKPVRASLDSLIKKNDSIAMLYRALMLHRGEGGYTRNISVAMSDMRLLKNFATREAKKGNAEALYLLFLATEISTGGTEPVFITFLPGTLFFLDQATRAGFLPAQFERASIHLRRDDSLLHAPAVRQLEDCYAKGLHRAATLLGIAYEMGIGVTADQRLSEEWYQKAIKVDDPVAMYRLALRKYAAKQPDEARALLDRSVALEYPDAMILLARIYQSGSGADLQKPKVVSLYKTLAKNGWYQGMEGLALLSLDERGFFRNEDTLGVHWARQGAVNGSAVCMALLANAYLHGRGVEESELIAKMWYQQAIDNGAGGEGKTNNPVDELLKDGLINKFGVFDANNFQAGLMRVLTNGMTSMQMPVNMMETAYQDPGREIYAIALGSYVRTGIAITENDLVIIHASGKVTIDTWVSVGPEGTVTRSLDQRSYVPEFRHGSLVAQLGDMLHPVGNKRYFSGKGELLLLVNDKQDQNNSGAFDLYLEVIRGGSLRR